MASNQIKEFKGLLNPVFGSSVDDMHDKSEIPSITENENFIRQEIPIDKLIRSSHQPRKFFDKSSISELAQSIQSKGVLQPIVVRPVEDGLFEIIIGERRWRASQEAGLKTIPAIIKNYTEIDCMAVSLIENIQRSDLKPLEEAEAVYKLLETCQLTHLQISQSIGKSRAAVTNLLRLLSLESEVKKLLNDSLIEMGHARALLGLSGQAQIDAARMVANRSLSVRDTEKLVNSYNNCKSSDDKKLNLSPELERKIRCWKERISTKLPSEVNITFHKGGKGKLTINFSSLEEADWLIDHIKIL